MDAKLTAGKVPSQVNHPKDCVQHETSQTYYEGLEKPRSAQKVIVIDMDGKALKANVLLGLAPLILQLSQLAVAENNYKF